MRCVFDLAASGLLFALMHTLQLYTETVTLDLSLGLGLNSTVLELPSTSLFLFPLWDVGGMEKTSAVIKPSFTLDHAGMQQQLFLLKQKRSKRAAGRPSITLSTQSNRVVDREVQTEIVPV